MKSTLGRRAMICKELGWSLGFVEHGISYVKLQMMLADLPRYISDGKDGEKAADIELTDDNTDEVMQMMLSHGARMKE